MLRILLVEDEVSARNALSDLLRRLGHEVMMAPDGQEACELLQTRHFDLILSDVRMPRMDGIRFFEKFLSLFPTGAPPFIFMTAYGKLDEAVDAMRKGALNFLIKPLRKKDIVQALEDATRVLENRRGLNKDLEYTGSDAVYQSKAFGEVVDLVDKVAASLASVIFTGESGTGKEVLARRLHQKSARAAQPFIAFHSGALPETLIESELFGHEKGAFTGADQSRIGLLRRAHNGTFFWDEISSMPASVQAKLLRIVQDREVQPLGARSSIHCDVRWVSASNVGLRTLVDQSIFREDLLFRLGVVVIDIPPLRERPEDIVPLTDAFLSQIARSEGKEPLIVPSKTREYLANYAWPGNVRELKNVVERAIALADGPELHPGLLPPHVVGAGSAHEIRIALGTTLKSVEDKLIEETLRLCGGDKRRAAMILGVAPRTVYRWLEQRQR